MTKVEFPIVRTVVYNNSPNRRVINKGDKVNCYFCNQKFAINTRTASVDEHDGMQMITCPNSACRRKIPVLYYFDRVIQKPVVKKKRSSKKKQDDLIVSLFGESA